MYKKKRQAWNILSIIIRELKMTPQKIIKIILITHITHVVDFIHSVNQEEATKIRANLKESKIRNWENLQFSWLNFNSSL